MSHPRFGASRVWTTVWAHFWSGQFWAGPSALRRIPGLDFGLGPSVGLVIWLPARLPSGLGGSRLGPHLAPCSSPRRLSRFGAFHDRRVSFLGHAPRLRSSGMFQRFVPRGALLGLSKRGSTFKSLPKSLRLLFPSCLPLASPWDVDCWRRHPSALGLVIPQGAQTLEPATLQASLTFFRSFVSRRRRMMGIMSHWATAQTL